MSKRPNPIDSLKLDSEMLEAVQEDYDYFLEALESERRQFGWRRFTEIDSKLGRRAGFMAKVVAGLESMTIDRLIALLKLLGRSLSEFFERFWPPARIPGSPAPGLLASFTGGTPRQELRGLVEWIDRAYVDPSGTPMTFDPHLVIRESESNRREALALAETQLRLLMRLKSPAITKDCAESLCRLLGAKAYVHRHADDLDHAAELLDMAFEVERKIGSTDTRAFLYRESAYLLSHLGFIEDAERFANKAVSLSEVSPTGKGLGESLYARAIMVKWQGDTADALQMLNGSLPHLAKSSPIFRQAALLESVWLHADLGQLDRAATHLGTLSESAGDLAPLNFGKYRLAHAVVHSMLGDRHLAEEHFTVAEELLRRHGTATDQALLLLRKCHHRLRLKMSLADMASQLTRLAGKMRPGSSGEAALLEVARAILADEVQATVLRWSIRAIERPWAQQPEATRI